MFRGDGREDRKFKSLRDSDAVAILDTRADRRYRYSDSHGERRNAAID